MLYTDNYSQKETIMTKKKLLSVILSVVMVMTMLALTGCGGEKKEEAPKPTSAEELLDASKKAMEDVENYSFNAKGSAEIKAGASGQEMSMPAEFEAEGEISDDVIHAKGSGSVEYLGQKQEASPEAYLDIKNKKAYAKMSADDSWSASDLTLETDDVSFEVPDSLKPELEFSEEDDAYVLTCDLSKIDIKELLKSIAEQQEGAEDMNLDDALAALDQVNLSLDSGTLTMKYDKETCLISSMTIKEFAGSGKTAIAEGQDMTITASVDMEFNFTDYNKVPADAFKLPEAK